LTATLAGMNVTQSPRESGGVARSAGVVPKQYPGYCDFGTTPRVIAYRNEEVL